MHDDGGHGEVPVGDTGWDPSAGTLAQSLADASPQETASYVAALLVELRKLAVANDMRFLVYLIEMAFEEAYKHAEGPDQEAA